MKSEEKTNAINCTYCHKQFKYESEKKRHEQSHTPQFQCKVCMKKFSFISALRRHEKQHDRVEDVWCKKCNRKFRDETLLKRHMKYAHKGTFVCSKCDTKFNSDVALRTHMKTHKPVSERQFRCHYEGCKKTFNFSHHLKHHELTHTNTKQYFCNICGKGFIQLHHLKTHLKSHTSERLLCTVAGCKKKFTNEYARKRHLATHSTTIDSGISSSDSNSGWEISDMKVEDSSKSPSCSQMIADGDLTTICDKTIDHKLNSPVSNILENSDIATPEDLTVKPLTGNKFDIDNFTSCKDVLGGCIVSSNGEVNENCLCAQINSTATDYNIRNECSKLTIANESDKVANTVVEKENTCEGCDCAEMKTKTNHDENKNNRGSVFVCPIPAAKKKDAFPELEYRKDGTIKIKETFDMDIVADIAPVVIRKEVKKEVWSFNSCKSVLGKCIVSENGMVGDGCLCAKMAFVDSINSEEIDEITPQPTFC